MPKYEQFKNAILARNKAKFDKLGIVDLVKSVRGGAGAHNKVGNATIASGKQKARAHGGFGILNGSGSRLKVPRNKARPLSTYALPPPSLSD
jgi:hypothetical protein